MWSNRIARCPDQRLKNQIRHLGAEYLSGGKVTKWLFYFMEEKVGFGYYVVVPTAVLMDERLTPNAKLLFGIIGNLANQRGYCFASNAYISELFGMHELTISRLINELIKAEWIIKFEEITNNGSQRRLRLNHEALANSSIGGKQKSIGGVNDSVNHNNIRLIVKEEYINNDMVNNSVNPHEIVNNQSIQILGKHSDKYVTIQPKTLGSIKYRLNGEDGLTEYYHINMSHIQRPEFTKKFLVDRNGKSYDDFQHLFNDMQLFVEKSFKR